MTPTNQNKHLNVILGLMFCQLMTHFKHRLVLFYFFKVNTHHNNTIQSSSWFIPQTKHDSLQSIKKLTMQQVCHHIHIFLNHSPKIQTQMTLLSGHHILSILLCTKYKTSVHLWNRYTAAAVLLLLHVCLYTQN